MNNLALNNFVVMPCTEGISKLVQGSLYVSHDLLTYVKSLKIKTTLSLFYLGLEMSLDAQKVHNMD